MQDLQDRCLKDLGLAVPKGPNNPLTQGVLPMRIRKIPRAPESKNPLIVPGPQHGQLSGNFRLPRGRSPFFLVADGVDTRTTEPRKKKRWKRRSPWLKLIAPHLGEVNNGCRKENTRGLQPADGGLRIV